MNPIRALRFNLILMSAALCLFNEGANGMRGRDVKLSEDHEVFSNDDGSGKVILDFNKGAFVIESKDQKVVTPLGKEYLARGQFFFITRSHALWLLRSPVEVPKQFNTENEEGIHPSTPVLILFEDGKEMRRITYKQTEFKNVDRHIGVGDRGKNDHWLEKFDIFIPRLSGSGAAGGAAGAYIPQITLFEPKSDFAIKFEIMTGRVMARSNEMRPPNVPHPLRNDQQSVIFNGKNVSEMLAQSAKYSEEMATVTTEYKSQLKEFSNKADKLSDKEVNEGVEKITADYNRKMLKLQVKFDDLSAKAKDTGPSKPDFPRQGLHGLEPDVHIKIPVTVDFNPKIFFHLPGLVVVKNQVRLAEHKVELSTPPSFQQPGLNTGVMQTIIISELESQGPPDAAQWLGPNKSGFSYFDKDMSPAGNLDIVKIVFAKISGGKPTFATKYYEFEIKHQPRATLEAIKSTLIESFSYYQRSGDHGRN